MNDFIDFIKIFCKSGDGGSGYVHFVKDKNTINGKPDGGSGGKGGDVIIKGNSQINTFIHLRYKKHCIADSGNSGKRNNITGSNGKNIVIDVPVGTIVKDNNNNLIVEIKKHSQKNIILKGGKGGKGNVFFKTSIKRSPLYAQSGIKTKGYWFFFELKILSDVGLIGFPNSGKSTLLSVITKAKPKIGNYPFTNKIPYLGVVKKGFDNFVVADIPGIIEKASEGKGLGYKFLRHIERNTVLLFLISSEEKEKKNRYLILLNELKKFNYKLLEKKRMLAISKSDLLDDIKKKKIFNTFSCIEKNIVFISSLNKEGLNILIKKLFILINS